MAKWPNAAVCKTAIHRFDSGRRLHIPPHETALIGPPRGGSRDYGDRTIFDHVRRGPPELEQVLAGLTSVRNRFETAAKADERFRDALPRSLELFFSEDAARLLDEPFFLFYASALACVEGLGYALAWLPYLSGRRARSPQPRSISFGDTVAEYRRTFRNEPITQRLEEVAKSSVMSEVRGIRNFLEHRGLPGYHAPGADGAMYLHTTQFLGHNLSLNEDLTAIPRTWLGQSLKSILGAAPDLANRYLSRA